MMMLIMRRRSARTRGSRDKTMVAIAMSAIGYVNCTDSPSALHRPLSSIGCMIATQLANSRAVAATAPSASSRLARTLTCSRWGMSQKPYAASGTQSSVTGSTREGTGTVPCTSR